MSVEEMMKLFDFILENKNIDITDNGLFNRGILTKIRAIARKKVPNDFNISDEQKQLIINAFINGNDSFNEDTPSFITENLECEKIAIKRDINSVNFIKKVSPDLESYIIDEALKHEFVLKVNSHWFLKSNFNVVSNSIALNSMSADFADWYSFDDKQTDSLIADVVKAGYTLSYTSPKILTSNLDVVLQSIKRDIYSIKYASTEMQDEPEVFKYLLLNDYPYISIRTIRSMPLKCFSSPEILKAAFKMLGVYDSDDEEYIERFAMLYNDVINKKPLIKGFDSVFQYATEECWKEHRKENFDNYDNIFGKICAELGNSSYFSDAVDNLSFLGEMRETLKEKYDVLYQAMKEYFNIFHSEVGNKLEEIQSSKDTIAKLSALYVSKSKEDYKKDKLEDYHSFIKEYFTLKIDNPYINKLLIQSNKKAKFRDLYENGDKDINDFVYKIVQTYSKDIDSNLVSKMIREFVCYDISKIEDIINVPLYYKNYIRYEKALKLINRLNSGYIQYDGVEVCNYKDIIGFDDSTMNYIYTGMAFNDGDLNAYNEYRKKSRIFEKIKKEIILKIQSMEFDGEINKDLLDILADDLPFTDEYFEFDAKYVLENFSIGNLVGAMPDYDFDLDVFVSDSLFANVHDLLVGKGLIWLLILDIEPYDYKFYENVVDSSEVWKIVDNMEYIVNIANDFHFNINNFGELLSVHRISECANSESLAVLGQEVIEKLCKNKDYVYYDDDDIINMAEELVCHMAKRNKSTVPYVSGKTMNYNYSLYDSQDETILVSGINTDACFKIGGNDNDFLHYCALDKNGTVIKITDSFGNFIARASGFRNGNCVFFNQLRTIYDEGGNCYNGEYDNERNDIIETFKMACEDIVNTSHQNPHEIDKIDYVFVTESYSLGDYDSNVPDNVTEQIGDTPVDNDSEDWEHFVNNTKNLQESEDGEPFVTDYGNYPLICMASSKDIEDINLIDIKPKNVPALYERKRNEIVVSKPDIVARKRVNKVAAMKSFFDGTEFTPYEIPETSTVFIGDNWYIIYDNGDIIDSCLLDFDNKARIEFDGTMQTVNQYVLGNNQQQLDVKQLSKKL